MGDFLLNHLTISKIAKQRKESPKVEFGKKVYRDEISHQFSREIVSSYFKKHSIEKSFFDKYSDGTVPRFQYNLDNYLNSERNEENFLQFSKNIIEILKEKMSNTPASVGGHLVIADVKMKYNFVFIALLNETNAFKVIGADELSLEKILDINHLAMAGFINLDLYKVSKEENNAVKYYVSFLRGLRDIAKYYVDFLGALNGRIELGEQTNNLIKAVKSYTDSLKLPEEEKEEKKQQVYKYLLDAQRNKEPINLDTISHIISPEHPDKFKEYVQDPNNNYNLDTIIDKIDTSRIRALISFRYRSKDFSISFELEKYKGKIKIIKNKDDENYNFVFEKAPKKFIEELKKEGIKEIIDE